MITAKSARALASLCAITLVLSSVPALSAPSASDKETARALMKDGEAKRGKGDLQGALQSFRAAHAIMNVPTTGLELGRAQMDLGMLVEARDTLLSVTRLPVIPGESANMPAAREEAQKLADDIEPRIPSLTIKLTGVPEGATPKVVVDGHEILQATIGVPRKHNPGSHVVGVTVNGVEKKQTVELAEGETREITIAVEEPKPDEPAPIDDVPPEPEKPSEGRSPLVYVGFGAAAAFAVVGGVTGALAFSRASTAKEGCDGNRCPPSTHDAIDSSKTFGTLSTISFALAGAGAIVGVIGLLSHKEERASATTGHAPALGVFVGASGVGLTGSF